VSSVALLRAAPWLVLAVSLSAREPESRPLLVQGAEPGAFEATVRGPQFHRPHAAFHNFEDSSSPRISRLRQEYGLDKVVAAEPDEFRRMLQLRHWVHTRWPIDNEQKFLGDAFEILEKAKAGYGFYCTHSMRVQHAVMTAMGFVARDLGVDSDHLVFGRSNHHGMNEVWSNQYAKWVLFDAKYDIHYERDGVPLSVLEVHRAVRAGLGNGIVKVQGPERREVPMKGLEYPTSSVLSYWWASYTPGLKTFTGKSEGSGIVVFDSDDFRRTRWLRDGGDGLGDHWAYRANAFIRVHDPNEIDWTVGVPGLELRRVARNELDVVFSSVTPNLDAYRVRVGDGPWQDVSGDRWRWKLGKVENTLSIRTRNKFGVEGPVVTARVRQRAR
jgi:hypothetical protein